MSNNKKFCGVCKNIGKSEAEYTSHYTKSVPGDKGIVVCPTILNNTCNKCHQVGHFSDHCKENVVSMRSIKRQEFTKKQEKKEETYDDLFPALSGSKRSRENVVKDNNQFNVLRDEVVLEKPKVLSYRNMLKKEPKIVIEEPKFASGIVDLKSYTKNFCQNTRFNSEFDLNMSKRIMPVEMDDYDSDDDDNWDGSWY
jgi:hypothetical protein